MVMKVMRLVFFYLCLACLSSVASCSPPPAPSASCAGTKTPFCGSTCSCNAQDDLKLRETFLGEVKRHGYHDADCRAELKAYLCTVCLPSAPASAPAEPFSNTSASKNNELSLPLRCAAPSVSIHDLTTPSTETPTPEWPPADDDGNASTTTKLVIGAIVSVLTLLGGFITYKVCKAKLCNNNQCCNNNECCTNIKCCLCFP